MKPRSVGHADGSTAMIYTHVLNRGGRGVVSPLDRAAGGQPAGGELAIPVLAWRRGGRAWPR